MTTTPAVDASLIDITTTSVGRDTIRRTYTSFFRHVTFSGSFRVLVTVDPAYGVGPEEWAATVDFLRRLPKDHPAVVDVVVEEFPRPVGLPAALSLLLANTRTPLGVHLEDDWEFTGPIDIDGLVADLVDGGGTQIVFSNSHTARGGTFERPDEAVPVEGTTVPLVRLTEASWAAQYLPLSPHLHLTRRWAAILARALATTDPDRCVDERVRDLVIAEGGAKAHNVLWTRDVVADDIGRPWMAERSRYRAITPAHRGTVTDPGTLPAPRHGPLTLTRSTGLRKRAERVTPGMTNTYQKRPENFADGAYPVYLERGDGALVFDVDGQSYVDFICALGAASLGHNHPVVANTIRERAGRGLLLSLPTPAEVEATEHLVNAVPGVEMARLVKTGAEAVSAALRVARGVTGRDQALLAGYHGWHDQLIGESPGVPAVQATLSTRTELRSVDDDLRLCAELARRGDRLAAVVLSTPYHRVLTTDFLAEVRRLCDRHGVLLVLDEVVTGFRLAPGGVGEFLGVSVDLVCFSKGMAAGAPLAAVAGPARTMRTFERLRVSSTFAGETLSLELMKAALRYYPNDGYYTRIADLGRQLRDGLNAVAVRHGRPAIAVGYDPMPCLTFSADPAEHGRIAGRFLAGMARRGVLLRRDVNFICAAHSQAHIDHTLAAAAEVIAEGID